MTTLELKVHHLHAAGKAIRQGRLQQASVHALEAAKHDFILAERSEGAVARAYVTDAEGLIDLAVRLKERASIPDRPSQDDPVEKAADTPVPGRLVERPKTRLADVAGMAEVRRILEDDVIKPLRFPETYGRFNIKPGGGVLLYGPPGNGKTLIAKALAGELDAAFFHADPAQIRSKWVGESEKNLARLFDEARAEKRAVIFLDEADALLGRTGNQKINVVTEFLIKTDGLTSDLGDGEMLLVLGATNKPWLLDPAVRRPGRFGKQIYVGLPDIQARIAILERAFISLPIEEGFPFETAADLTDLYSGADLQAIVNETALLAAAREVELGQPQAIGWADFECAVSRTPRSVSPLDLEPYEAWRKAIDGSEKK